VTFFNATDDSGKINNEWISGIRQIIEWVINYNMYFILSINFEGNYFLIKSNKDKYINFWTQITNEFVDINEYLIIESKNIVDYDYLYNYSEDNKNNDYYDEYDKIHNNLLNCTQGFVDVVRHSGGYNSDRLLILSGLVTEIEINYYGYFFELELPKDPSNKLAVSLNYLFPSENYINFDAEPMLWYNKYGMAYYTNPIEDWGSELDYRQIMKVFDFLKKYYLDIEIPVIFGEVGIILNENDNNINKMEEFLYVIFSISSEYNGIMSCLWDISEIIERNINYYDKKNNLWRDEKIRDNLIKISKGKYVHLSKYYYMTNFESENVPIFNILDMDIGKRKITKIILNHKFIMLQYHVN
jgi:endoglucanase